MCRNMENFVERRNKMPVDERLLRFVLLLILGLVFVVAGIFHWPFPSIKPWWRTGKYGEFLNTVVMIIAGICIIIGAFDFYF